jgi:hypothetical protein
LAKSLSFTINEEKVLVASISLQKVDTVSSSMDLSLLASLPVSLQLGIGISSLGEFLSQLNLSNVKGISLLAGTSFDVSLLLNKLASISLSSTVGVVVLPGIVIIIDREIVSILARDFALNTSNLDESSTPYQVFISDRPTL